MRLHMSQEAVLPDPRVSRVTGGNRRGSPLHLAGVRSCRVLKAASLTASPLCVDATLMRPARNCVDFRAPLKLRARCFNPFQDTSRRSRQADSEIAHVPRALQRRLRNLQGAQIRHGLAVSRTVASCQVCDLLVILPANPPFVRASVRRGDSAGTTKRLGLPLLPEPVGHGRQSSASSERSVRRLRGGPYLACSTYPLSKSRRVCRSSTDGSEAMNVSIAAYMRCCSSRPSRSSLLRHFPRRSALPSASRIIRVGCMAGVHRSTHRL